MPPRPAKATDRPAITDDPRTWPWSYRWVLFLLQAGIIALCAWIAIQVPTPLVEDWLPVKNVLVGCVAIILTGKSLFDTLFFDRFRP